MSLIGFVIDRVFPPPPPAIEHPGIGCLEQDRHRPTCYAGAVDWPDGSDAAGQITLILHDKASSRRSLRMGAEHFLGMRAQAAQVRQAATDCAGEHLYTKWRDEWFFDEEEMPLDRWKAQLRIKRIWVEPAGDIAIDFAFNRPFEGHYATSSGIAPDRFHDASLSI